MLVIVCICYMICDIISYNAPYNHDHVPFHCLKREKIKEKEKSNQEK